MLCLTVCQQTMQPWLPAQAHSMKLQDRKFKLFRRNFILIQSTEFMPVSAVEAKKFVRGIKRLNMCMKRKALKFNISDSDLNFGEHIQTLSGLKHISNCSRPVKRLP